MDGRNSLARGILVPSFLHLHFIHVDNKRRNDLLNPPAYSEVHIFVGEDPETEIAVHLVKDCFVCEYGLR